jgi:NTE family protein
MKKRKKLGVALGSGGARGLYHIGVLKALVKNDIPIDYLAGSSVGAWIGGHYALNKDIEKLEEFTVGKKMEKLMGMFEISFSGGFIKGEKLQRLLGEWLEDAQFSDLKIPFRAIATDLIAGNPVVFKTGNLASALRASMAIPGVFAPVSYQKKLFIDGGISNPVPDDVLRQMGADVVLAVDLNGIPHGRDTGTVRSQTISDTLKSAVNILCYHLAVATTQDADIVLHPYLEKYAGWTDYLFTNKGREAITLGERETRKIVPELRKKLEK